MLPETSLEFPSGNALPDGQRASNHLMTALMDRVECGLIACAANGRLIHANLSAQRELRDGGSLRLDGHTIVCTASNAGEWHLALSQAVRDGRSGLLSLNGPRQPLLAAIMPTPSDVHDAPVVLVMLGRRAACSPLGLELFASAHGLTLAESRVLRALLSDMSTREIADAHGVAMATIRTQIQAMREKLAVRSIDALLLRVAELPPISARH